MDCKYCTLNLFVRNVAAFPCEATHMACPPSSAHCPLCGRSGHNYSACSHFAGDSVYLLCESSRQSHNWQLPTDRPGTVLDLRHVLDQYFGCELESVHLFIGTVQLSDLSADDDPLDALCIVPGTHVQIIRPETTAPCRSAARTTTPTKKSRRRGRKKKTLPSNFAIDLASAESARSEHPNLRTVYFSNLPTDEPAALRSFFFSFGTVVKLRLLSLPEQPAAAFVEYSTVCEATTAVFFVRNNNMTLRAEIARSAIKDAHPEDATPVRECTFGLRQPPTSAEPDSVIASLKGLKSRLEDESKRELATLSQNVSVMSAALQCFAKVGGEALRARCEQALAVISAAASTCEDANKTVELQQLVCIWRIALCMTASTHDPSIDLLIDLLVKLCARNHFTPAALYFCGVGAALAFEAERISKGEKLRKFCFPRHQFLFSAESSFAVWVLDAHLGRSNQR